jgi:alkylation response protein AidB-like acyl-CoA dehydrogenase
LIVGAADRMERDRALTPEVLAALYDRELFRMLLPRACGGAEAHPAVFVETVEEVARADASTAWCVGQACGGSTAAAYLALDVARDIFADPHAVVASGPTFGTAVAVDGGYRVSGAWGFASGSKHATTLAAHCLVQKENGEPARDAEGNPLERTVFFPKAKAAFTDIWDVMGLKGTGSDKYTVKDLFVPAAYSYTRESAAERRETGPLYRISHYNVLGAGFAGVALGIARGALDAFTGLARDKTPANAPRLRDSASIQYQVGLSETRLRSARTFLLRTLHEVWDHTVAGEALSLDQRATFRMAITNGSHQARKVMETVYQAAGSTAIFANQPFERRFRDLHAVTQQVQAHASNFELVGQHFLGMNPKSKFL